VFGFDDNRRFSLPVVKRCAHSLNICLNALGGFDAIVACEQVFFNMLDFPPWERAEQIRFQRPIIGVSPGYCMHSSTPSLGQRIFLRCG